MDKSEFNPDVSELQRRLGHGFEKVERLESALAHRSFAVEAGHPMPDESQRLEFLGDAVLGAISAEWLFGHCAGWREGPLTKVRSRLTNEAALARVARRLDLGRFIRLGKGEEQGGGREKDAVLADAVEAVIGALWLDGGAEAARKFFREGFSEEIEAAVEAGGDENPKGELQEWMQREWKASPRYELVEETGPAHERLFRVAVYREEERMGEGEGKSKRQAEMRAAQQALRCMEAKNGKRTDKMGKNVNLPHG